MKSFAARHFDGRSSAAHAVRVDLAGAELCLVGEDGRVCVPRARVRVGDRLGSAPRVIYLEGAGELHSDDQEAVDDLARALGQGRLGAGVFLLESRTWVALAALVLSVAVLWSGLRHGLPWLAGVVAELVPASVEAGMGEQTLAALDQWVFKPSALPAARQGELRGRLAAMCLKADCPAWRLEFRHGGEIGANALALPGGTLVFTDDIVKLARHDDELLAVAAHELGHVRHHHGLRMVLAGAGVVLLGQVLLGDLGGIGDLASGLPALLLQTGYSRGMEAEADDHALALLRRACVPPQRFADILVRLDAGHESGHGSAMLFATHPETRQRIEAFRHGAAGCSSK